MSRAVRGLCGVVAIGAIAGGTLTTAAYAKPASDPLAKLSASQIVKKTVADMKSASSFRYYGSASYQKARVTVSLSLTSKGCTGSMGLSTEGSFVIVAIGTTVYVQPSDKFWETNGVPASELSQVHGKWLKSTGTGSNSLYAAFGPLCSPSKLSGSLGIVLTGMTKGKITKISGHTALQLRNGSENIYVSVSSKPEFLRISESGDTISFGSYGAKVTLTPPPASDIISLPGTASAIRTLVRGR